MKLLLRERARALRVPVLMETSDRGMLDIERFDEDAERPLLHGLLGDMSSAKIPDQLSDEERIEIALKFSGSEGLSTRLAASLLEIGNSLSTWPQLGADVTLGGASVTTAVRRFALGEPLPSGRYYVDLSALLAGQPDADEVPVESTAFFKQTSL